ncbi:GTPase-activating protein gyp7-like, partial [Camellia sinensis]|uniref:GTPase-activating protein gyp7-like n=1 Tax=Camellia sinensis TaxID=4442 RepID=UPI001035EB1F
WSLIVEFILCLLLNLFWHLIVSEERAHRSAEAVALKDYDHLEPARVFHAARLVAILEAYALYDPEIGYCQGMSDLLSPIITVILEDHEAFWCFVGFMRKARHNFRLDEVGIRQQLNTVSKIIKCKDSHLYRHLEMLQAEDCFFVYRMVVVLFRRELTFEQTICLWEVMSAKEMLFCLHRKYTRSNSLVSVLVFLLFGKRAIAGRVVKESYGAAKQRHTFTMSPIEVRGLTQVVEEGNY